MRIADLPFRERPVHELLNFDQQRSDVDASYAGYGWARVPRIWIGEMPPAGSVEPVASPGPAGARSIPAGSAQWIADALVLALHSCDIGEVLANDIELEFELPGAEPVSVLVSQFLEVWLPRLPSAGAIVLAMCNPHHATLTVPAGLAKTTAPIYYATGDVESWLDAHEGGRVELLAAGSWATLAQ